MFTVNIALQAQYTFQSYLVVAEKPKFALTVVIAAGISNMVLDYLFMVPFHMGVAGAALATGLSQCVCSGVAIYLVYKREESVFTSFYEDTLRKQTNVACLYQWFFGNDVKRIRIYYRHSV